MAEPETISIKSLRSRICEARSIVESIGADAHELWVAAPSNTFACEEAGNIHDALEDVATALGELEGD
jgi:hypothetical protein